VNKSILTKREVIAVEALKILLPEVQKKHFFRSLFQKKQITYDMLVRDAVYIADVAAKHLDES
jgi:hypothetical protein